MVQRSYIVATFVVSIALTSGFSNQVFAEEPAAIPPGVSCATAASSEDADFAKRYRENPDAVIGDSKEDGLSLSNVVRALALADSSNMATISAVLAKADDTQKAAIGAGLARAAFTCGELKQQAQVDYADKIAAFVAQSTDTILIGSYAKSSQDIKVAAVSTPAGGDFAGGGDVTGDSSQTDGANNFSWNSNSPIDTTSGAYTIDGVNPLNGRDEISPG